MLCNCKQCKMLYWEDNEKTVRPKCMPRQGPWKEKWSCDSVICILRLPTGKKKSHTTRTEVCALGIWMLLFGSIEIFHVKSKLYFRKQEKHWKNTGSFLCLSTVKSKYPVFTHYTGFCLISVSLSLSMYILTSNYKQDSFQLLKKRSNGWTNLLFKIRSVGDWISTPDNQTKIICKI